MLQLGSEAFGPALAEGQLAGAHDAGGIETDVLGDVAHEAFDVLGNSGLSKIAVHLEQGRSGRIGGIVPVRTRPRPGSLRLDQRRHQGKQQGDRQQISHAPILPVDLNRGRAPRKLTAAIPAR